MFIIRRSNILKKNMFIIGKLKTKQSSKAIHMCCVVADDFNQNLFYIFSHETREVKILPRNRI